MLQRSSDKARRCYMRAAEAKRRAAEARSDEERFDFLQMEEKWLKLANSFELAERTARYLAQVTKDENSATRAKDKLWSFCSFCGGPLRLDTVAPIPHSDGAENRSYQCIKCGHAYVFTVATEQIP